MSKSSPRYGSGIPLERAASIFLNKMRLPHSHNDFSPSKYVNDNHNVVDIVVDNRVLIECTNPKETTFMNDQILNSKIDYFHRKDPEHKFPLWILVTSFMVFSKEILAKLYKEGIQLVVLDMRTTEDNIHKIVRKMFNSKLYESLQTFFHNQVNGKPMTVKQLRKNIVSQQVNSEILNNKDLYKNSNVVRNYTVNNYHLYQHKVMAENLQLLSIIPFLTKFIKPRLPRIR
jgi:hypothetical protein